MTKPSSGKHHELTPRKPVSRAPVVRQILWASVPIWSISFLAFAPFLAYAITRRRRADWAVFAAYLAATIGVIVAAGSVGSGNGGSGVVGGFVIALAGCAAVHAAILFRPGNAQAPGRSAAPVGARQHNKDAIAEAKDRIERRRDARRLAETDPALARDLRIGRPDLPRDYDDGGLVDVNHVPGTALGKHLGLTHDEVTDVIGARDKLGKFTSAEELCAYTELPPDRVDELRDLMIFS